MHKKAFVFGSQSEPINPYIIAEVGINHNGSVDRCIEMIEVAAEAGVDAVKFQTFVADELCGDSTQLFSYHSQGKKVTEPMLDMFKRNELPIDAWPVLKTACHRAGVDFLSTPQNISDLDLLISVGIEAIKVGSDDFTNLPLLSAYAERGLPMIISCGMSDIGEVHCALDAVGWYEDRVPIMLLLCTSQYPTPAPDVNISKISTLRSAFPGLNVGFSDHTAGSTASIMAVALGATLFEKHFTLSKDLPGPDHWFSESPESLALWVQGIREASMMTGNSLVVPTKAEYDMRTLARRILLLSEISRQDNCSQSKILQLGGLVMECLRPTSLK